MRKTIKNILAVIVAVAIISSIPWPAEAAVRKLRKADHPVSQRHIVKVVTRPGFYIVTLNNGARWRATPCPTEDSINCYWDARRQGNRFGFSFLDLRGTAIFRQSVRY